MMYGLLETAIYLWKIKNIPEVKGDYSKIWTLPIKKKVL